jgi:hypothetical protein
MKLRTYSSAGARRISSGVPTCTTWPSFMMAMRSPMRMASSRSCEMKTMVRRLSCCRRSSSSCMSVRMIGSSAEKASSISRMDGSAASARARPTRCCMPPDSSSG